VSARETIENLWDRSGVDISALLDAYAHELSDEIRGLRESDVPADPDSWPSTFKGGYDAGVFLAARLIDPHTNKEY
jgi:hypothetical protein